MVHSVLVVDDDRAARDGIVEALDQHGFVGIPASNGEQALEYLRAGGGASVILLDLVMPDMDGWTFRRAQECDPRIADIPVIVISGRDGRAVAGARPIAVFQKPIVIDLLIRTVQNLCRRVDSHSSRGHEGSTILRPLERATFPLER